MSEKLNIWKVLVMEVASDAIALTFVVKAETLETASVKVTNHLHKVYGEKNTKALYALADISRLAVNDLII